MPRPTAVLTRVLGVVLVAVLSGVPTLSASVAGTPAETDPVGVWPLAPPPPVIEGFDPPDSPWGGGHRGVDLLGSPGAPVRAAMAGQVSFAGRLAGRGVVVVDHGATRTTYEPVTATVEPGDSVPAGGRIGTLETIGSHCFPRSCLHWGWLRGETYLDPLGLVGVAAVRLLPLWRDAPVSFSVGALQRPSVAPAYAGWVPLVDRLGLRPADAPAGRPAAGGPW